MSAPPLGSFVLRAPKREQGTGWLLWPDLVVTALHVVGQEGGAGQWSHDAIDPPPDVYTLTLPGGPTPIAPLLYDPAADVALLRLPEAALAGAPDDAFSVLAPGPPLVGDPWHAVGFPAFETSGRAIAVGGVVSLVEPAIRQSAMQLLVDQGTSVAWGGISGCPARNAWGEVFGLVVQTVSGVATCNASPVAAIPRLQAMLARRKEIEDRLEAALRKLDPGSEDSVAGALSWSFPTSDPRWSKDPARALAERIFQSGPPGLGLALAAIAQVSEGKVTDPVLAAIAAHPEARPTAGDLDAVLQALADAGGSVAARGDLRAALPGMPAQVVSAALDRLLDARSIDGTRGDGGSATLTARGALSVIRIDYARAALRALTGVDGATTAQLQAALPIAPRQLQRALVLAGLLRWIDSTFGTHSLRPEGRAELDRAVRVAPPGGASDPSKQGDPRDGIAAPSPEET